MDVDFCWEKFISETRVYENNDGDDDAVDDGAWR